MDRREFSKKGLLAFFIGWVDLPVLEETVTRGDWAALFHPDLQEVWFAQYGNEILKPYWVVDEDDEGNTKVKILNVNPLRAELKF